LTQPIKELGTFAIAIKLPRDVAASVSVHVVKKQDAEPQTSE
jgi:large subunit ribosomal protein L9